MQFLLRPDFPNVFITDEQGRDVYWLRSGVADQVGLWSLRDLGGRELVQVAQHGPGLAPSYGVYRAGQRRRPLALRRPHAGGGRSRQAALHRGGPRRAAARRGRRPGGDRVRPQPRRPARRDRGDALARLRTPGRDQRDRRRRRGPRADPRAGRDDRKRLGQALRRGPGPGAPPPGRYGLGPRAERTLPYARGAVGEPSVGTGRRIGRRPIRNGTVTTLTPSMLPSTLNSPVDERSWSTRCQNLAKPRFGTSTVTSVSGRTSSAIVWWAQPSRLRSGQSITSSGTGRLILAHSPARRRAWSGSSATWTAVMCSGLSCRAYWSAPMAARSRSSRSTTTSWRGLGGASRWLASTFSSASSAA